MPTRDKTVDALRGLAMVWVIVVHVLYWGFFFSNRAVQMLMSFCLFEMPLFFFVTGAGNSYSRGTDYLPFVVRRYKRVLVPYWVYALICAALSLAKFAVEREVTPVFALQVLVSWLIPVDLQMTSVPYLTSALWFVPAYLGVVLVLPLLMRACRSRRGKTFAAVLAAVFLLTCVLQLNWLRIVAFYSFWTYVGLYYGQLRTALGTKKFRLGLAALAAGGTALICGLYVAGFSVNMQHNKFPPTVVFFLFSLVMMSLILLALPLIGGIWNRLEGNRLTGSLCRLYSGRSMTVFLYQVFAFNLTVPLTNRLLPGSGLVVEAAQFLACLAMTLPLCAVLAVIFGGIEQLGISSGKTK